MPPSKKKQSKSQSRLSNGGPSGSPQTPLAGSASGAEAASEEDFLAAIDEASNRFPRLIGKSALVARVADVESESTESSKGCKIWMSEPSMVASSVAPGSIVSVSLPCSMNRLSHGCPLNSLADEFNRNTGINVADRVTNAPGNYFALATVFPSSKVSSNGVRLSLNLSLALGCPASGRVVLIFPVQSPGSVSLLSGIDRLHISDNRHLSLQNCKELCLELACTNEFTYRSNMSSSIKQLVRKDHNFPSNGHPSSPRTPPPESRMTSPCSPLSSQLQEELVSTSSNQIGSRVDSIDIIGLLDDEISKKLLQTRMTSLLYSRVLLEGNLIIFPILSKRYIFRVIAKQRSSNQIDQDNVDQRGDSSLPVICDSLDCTNHASIVTGETKICLSLPTNMVSKPLPETGLPHSVFLCNFDEVKVTDDNLKLGGLSKEYNILMDIIASSCMENNMSRFGLRNTKGVLLHGPPGTGKTSLAQLCSRDACINFFSVGPETISQYYGESEQALAKVFDCATRAAPALIFIDELDAIAPARKEGGEDLSQRIVATLLTLMDGITSCNRVLVISATNRPDSVEPALRRPGRFDREIEIGVPSPKQRLEILHSCLSQMEHTLSDAQIQQLAVSTHGFVGADLASLCNAAARSCLRRYDKIKKSHKDSYFKSCVESVSSDGILEDNALDVFPSSSSDQMVQDYGDSNEDSICLSSEGLVKEDFTLRISFEDFENAKMKVRPSAMREVILEVPKVKWEDVGGQKEVKNQLMEAVEWPQKHQDALNRIGTRAPRGILMFGPPGCSKTLMARAVASEAGLNFLAVKGPELYSKWVGESEKAVRSVFAKARANAPSIIFFDEIDGLGGIRGKESDGVSVSDRVMSQLLVELDGLHQRVGVTVIAATNRPDKIDSALLRPGRFDRLLYVGPPNQTDREEIFSIHLRRTPCSSNVSIKELACLTEGFTGADISLICREAAYAALQEDLDASVVTMEHLRTAIMQVEPSEIESYQELSGKFQRLVHSTAKGDSEDHL